MIPCILHRLNCLLVAEELRCEIYFGTGLGRLDMGDTISWTPIRFQVADARRPLNARDIGPSYEVKADVAIAQEKQANRTG